MDKRFGKRFWKKLTDDQGTGGAHPVWSYYLRVLPLHFAASMVVYFLVELISRRSLSGAVRFAAGSPLVFLYNSFLIFVTTTAAFLFRRRFFVCLLVLIFWLLLGIVNGVILSNRVTPFTGPDLKLLQDAQKVASNYMSVFVAVGAAALLILLAVVLVLASRKGPVFKGKRRIGLNLIIIAASVGSFFGVTNLAIHERVISSYFGNLASAYEDYGFPYCFGVTLFDTGIGKPNEYSEKLIQNIEKKEGKPKSSAKSDRPNLIFVQLESFFDPQTVRFLHISEDPLPNFHQLMKEYSSGYLQVPVVGAGTVNTEFEAITGMSLRYFGAGEYPYKTILSEKTCESIPYDLRNLGYRTHAIHNNEANFYARKTVYKRLGFESFTSEEYMPDISDKTETGWVKDHILTDEIVKALDSTDEPDYIYTVSVQGHGSYPTEPVVENPKIRVTGAEGREQNNNSWEYYCKQINEMDTFVRQLTERLSGYSEPCVVVFYGDHLPTMGLKTADLSNRYLFQTPYLIWSNYGMKKQDEDLTSYQIGAEVLDRVGIHTGTMVRYHQTREGTRDYQIDMQDLQYDMLYGEQFVYNGSNPWPMIDTQLGTTPVQLTGISQRSPQTYVFHGQNFTESSKIEINGKVEGKTIRLSTSELYLEGVELKPEDTADVAQKSNSSTGKMLSRTEPTEVSRLLSQQGQ